MAAQTTTLQITYSNELINGETIHISSNCLPVKTSQFEPAGRSFHDIAVKLSNRVMEENTAANNQNLPTNLTRIMDQNYYPVFIAPQNPENPQNIPYSNVQNFQHISNFQVPPNFQSSSQYENPSLYQYQFHPLYPNMQFPQQNPNMQFHQPNPNTQFFSHNPNMQFVAGTPTPPVTTKINGQNTSGIENINLTEAGDKRQMWTKEDELLMTKAWLQISKDCKRGTSERTREFWQRILTYYDTNNTSGIKRKRNNIKTHWHYMNPRVSAFNQIYIDLKSQHVNDWSEDEIKTEAHKQYYTTTRKEFRYEHVWSMVRNDPKWKPTNSIDVENTTKKNKTNVVDIDVEVEVEVENRFISEKKEAKKALKRKASVLSSTRLDKVLEKHCEEKVAAINRLQKTMDALNKVKEEKIKLEGERIRIEAKQIKIEAEKMKIEAEKIKNTEIATLFLDTKGMSEIGRQVYVNRCNEIRVKYNL